MCDRRTKSAPPSKSMSDPPRAIVRKMRWPFPIIWIVPVVAAALAGYFLYQRHQERGSEITIQFNEAQGLKPGESALVVRGVTVGQVKSVELSEDLQHVNVQARLATAYSSIAKTDTVFWLVRPEISLENVSGLNTLMSGPYIEANPGDGAPTKTFKGLEQAPRRDPHGMKIILHADQIGQLTLDSPVNYRGIQVGVVQDIRLSDVADSVNVTVVVWNRYRDLVRSNSQFWVVKGAELKGGLFTGVKLQLDSLRSILTGGVAFATPEKNSGEAVAENSQFFLNDQSKDEWLKWKPKIPIEPHESRIKETDESKSGGGLLGGTKH